MTYLRSWFLYWCLTSLIFHQFLHDDVWSLHDHKDVLHDNFHGHNNVWSGLFRGVTSCFWSHLLIDWLIDWFFHCYIYMIDLHVHVSNMFYMYHTCTCNSTDVELRYMYIMILVIFHHPNDINVIEVLPLVEFVLDSSLTDEEAVQILDLSIPKEKKEDRQWKEGRIGRILCLMSTLV